MKRFPSLTEDMENPRGHEMVSQLVVSPGTLGQCLVGRETCSSLPFTFDYYDDCDDRAVLFLQACNQIRRIDLTLVHLAHVPQTIRSQRGNRCR
jgi:hypothetical protein